MAKESQPSQTTGQVVRVEAQPTRISLELGRRAVLVIDMQNDFGAKGGMFDLLGINLSMIHGAVGYRPLVGLRSKTSLYRYDALLTSARKSERLALLGGSPPNFLPSSIFSLVSGKNVR